MTLPLTINQLKFLIPYSSLKDREKFIEPLNLTMGIYKINTPLRVAAFIAQVTHESGSLHYVQEIADGSAYEWRRDLGNLEEEALVVAHANGTTTGRFFRGAGLIQVTGYYNYKKCSEGLGIDFVTAPNKLTEPLYAALSAGWYWDTHQLNKLADVRKFRDISVRINGGTNGLKDRLANYERCLKVLGI
ncbi:MAG: glycoside hydrolase family 19 protein [Balneolaceae bacterium]